MKKYIKGTFVVYIVIVFMLTLMPYNEEITYVKTFNIIPFVSISAYASWLDEIALMNLFGNMFLLFPFGLLYPLVSKYKASFVRTSLYGFAVTLFVEVMQFFFLTSRRFDVDDLIFNTLGAMLGYAVYKLCIKLFNKKDKSII